MAEPCLTDIDKLKLVRDGSEQADRFPAELDPASVPVYGRGAAQAMLFAREYSAFLRYYTTANTPAGDWQAFFSEDVSVALAAAAVQDVNRFRTVLRTCLDALQDPENAGSFDAVRRNLGLAFGMLGTLAVQLDALKDRLPEDIAVKATITNLIRTRLAQPLKRLVSWFNADQALPESSRLLEPSLEMPQPLDVYDVSILGVASRSFQEMLDQGLSSDWRANESWEELCNTAADVSVFGDPGGTPFGRASACARHALFGGACDAFLKVYARVVSDAGTALKATLADYDRHDPHYALLLTFLRMFEYARVDINALGGKHLDFYYRKVLQLAPRPARPAHAHVLVELGKNVVSHELAQGTELKAGKDAQGSPVVFTSDAAFVANRAAVSSLARVYRNAANDAIYVDPGPPPEDDSWHPFQNEMEIGSFGFAVASHYLYLAEGTRTITLQATVEGGSAGLSLAEAVLCRLTTEKGWLEISPQTCKFTSATALEIIVLLDGDQPAITAFDSDVHEATYDVALPVMEIKLKAQSGMLAQFAALESVSIRSIVLTADVVGLRSLVLSNDLGPVDPSKPFQPFGPSPGIGSAFIVGAPEAFSKQGLSEFELSLAWRALTRTFKTILPFTIFRERSIRELGAQDIDASFDEESGLRDFAAGRVFQVKTQAVNASIRRLKGGAWTEPVAEVKLLSKLAETLELSGKITGQNPSDDPDLAFATPFGLEASSGYLKVQLEDSLGHETYAQEVAQYAITVAGGGTAAMPSQPFTPELTSITLSYKTTQTIDVAIQTEKAYDERVARFYHVTPFGLTEQHGFQRTELEEPSVPLLPLLRHRDVSASTRVSHEGELYIGLDGVAAPQNVALLFQVVDGSANPLARKPNPHLHFSYLRNGNWVAFPTGQVQDGTSELLESGIVIFSVPADASVGDTLLPGSLTWIRIGAGERTDAVCRLLGVKSQAFPVTFSDRDNDLSFLSTPLAAGTIGKLMTPIASVKSVSQPYESFGARSRETTRDFHARVSERLRHKDRGITLWDIERLVLQAFSGIHRVKCLNHLRYEPTASAKGIYQELAPGHITVVTIPSVSKGYGANPLTPYASLSVLEEIDAFLRERMSCFATLHVTNPAYETLRVACNVKLREGCDETFSLNALRTAVTQFLAPWAYDASHHPSFEGQVYRAALVNYLEEQDCVDFVTDFRLYQTFGDGTESEAQTVATGTRAVSVLASVPAEKHAIAALRVTKEFDTPETCGCSP